MKTLEEVVKILKNDEAGVNKAKKEFGFGSIRLYKGDNILHFLVTDKDKGLKADNALQRRIGFKKYFEKLTGCEIKIDIFNNIRENFQQSYLENSISLKEKRKKIIKFFPLNAQFQTIELDSDEEIIDSLRKISTEEKEAKAETEYEKIMREEKWTPLFLEIYRGNTEKVKKIVSEDINSITHRDRLGNNAYLLAASYGRIDIFDWLTKNEIVGLNKNELSLDVRNSEGWTPFLGAAYSDELDFIKHLLNKYPERKKTFLTEEDRFGKNAYRIAKFYKNTKVAEYIKSLQNASSAQNEFSSTTVSASSSSQSFFNASAQLPGPSLNASQSMPSHNSNSAPNKLRSDI